MKRVGLYFLIVAAVVLGIEGMLSVLRQRSIAVGVEVINGPEQEAAAEAEGGTLLVAPESTVAVDLTWVYRIGPRFPNTEVRAQVKDEAGQVVAAERYLIDCSAASSLACEGSQRLALQFGRHDGAESTARWPVGSYQLEVVRHYASGEPAVLLSRTVQVTG